MKRREKEEEGKGEKGCRTEGAKGRGRRKQNK